MTEKPKYKFGLKRCPKHDSDHVLCFTNYEKIDLPQYFCLSDIKNIKVFNQGSLNSCTSNAVSNQLILSVDNEIILPSRLFMYFNSRLEDSSDSSHSYRSICIDDSGATLASTYSSILKYSIIDNEEIYPYNEENVNKFPPVDIYRIAHKTRNYITSYRKVLQVEYNLKYILYKYHKPIVFGMAVYENFMLIDDEQYVLRHPYGQKLGDHAVLIIGYDDNDKTFIVQNSHGEEFGYNKGKFKLGYEYALNSDLCGEFYVINT